MTVIDGAQRIKKTKKKSPAPEDLFIDPVAVLPTAAKSPSPEDLGLPQEQQSEPGEKTFYNSPEQLGLANPAKPMPEPVPEEGSWQDVWDWSERQIEAAGEVVTGGLEYVRESLGMERTPEFKQDQTRRVQRPNMDEGSGIVDTVVDWLVPDSIEDLVVTPVKEFVTSKRTQRNLYVGADKAAGGFVAPTMRGLTKGAKKIFDFARDELGVDIDYWQRSPEEQDKLWQEILDYFETQGEYFLQRAAQNQMPDGERTTLDALTEILPSIPVMIVGYGGAGALIRSPMLGFAALDSATAWGEDKSAEEVAFAAGKGAALGKLLEWTNILSRPLRVPVLAAAGGGLAATEGAPTEDILANAIVFPILGALPKSGPVNVRYLKEYGVKADLRDIGGHIRDLLVGGNVSRAKQDLEAAEWELKKRQSQHKTEETEEMMKWQSELAEARIAREGDTPEILQSRIAEANRKHEERIEEYSKRFYNEETPLREIHDHARRRYERAQHPFKVSWEEAPYMRSLHLYEKNVVSANYNSINTLQRANEEALEKISVAQERSRELRGMAEAEPNPVQRRKLERLADHVEDEAMRVTYQIRSRAEENAETKIEQAEQRASVARYELALVVGKRNKIEYRRAMQMATDRDLQDAYRAGSRKLTRGNRRARELLKKGDDIVARAEERLKRDGVTKDNEETVDLYEIEMQRAFEAREMYREMAAFELYEARSAADFRISMAQAAYDAAINPVYKPTMHERLLEWLGLKAKEQGQKTGPVDSVAAQSVGKTNNRGTTDAQSRLPMIPGLRRQDFAGIEGIGIPRPRLPNFEPGELRNPLKPQFAKERGRQPRNQKDEELTSPDDAKKQGRPEDDPPPERDPVPPLRNFEERYRSLMQHSARDPHLGKLQNQVDQALAMITRPEDVFPAINYIAKQYDYDPPSRRGKQTAQMRREAAEKLGMSSDEFLESPYGKAFNDAELEAIIMIVDRQWVRVQRAYEIWRLNQNSNQAFSNYQVELYRYMMIWERVRGAAAEAGRSLRVFRDFKARHGQVGRPLTETEYRMIMAGDGAAAMRLLKAFERGGWWNMFIEYWVNNLLSGPATAMVNTLSGFTMVAYKGILQPSVAAAWGITRGIYHRTISAILFKPFRKIYRLLIRNLGTETARKNLRIREKAEEYLADGVGAQKMMVAEKNRIRFGEVGARVRGMMEGIFSGIYHFFRTFFTGERFMAETAYVVGGGAHIPWWLGGPIIRFPGRIMQSIDSFFQAIMYRSAMRGYAYRLATAEYAYSGFKTMNGWLRRRERYREIMKHPDSYVTEMARREALDGTFQNPMGREFEGIPSFVSKHPSLRILMPFVKTPLNVLEFVLSGTPAAVLFQRARRDLLGFNGKQAQDMAVAHMIITTGMSYMVFLWALGGNVARPYPKDEKGRTIQGIAGVPPLSVRIPGTKEWVQVNRIDPMGAIISLGSSAASVYRIATASGDAKKAEEAWSIFFASVFSMIADRSGFKGLVDFFNAFQGGASGNDYKSWSRWANKTMATAAVPQVIATWARTKDPVIRRAETLLDQIYARVPGKRETLPAVRNLWGDPIVGYDSYGSNDTLDYTMPIYWGRTSGDPASELMIQLFNIYDWAPGTLDRQIQGRELTAEEYDYYTTVAGQNSYAAVSQIANSDDVRKANELEKKQKDLRKKIDAKKLEFHFRPEEQGFIGAYSEEGLKKFWKEREALVQEFIKNALELRRLRYRILQKTKNAISDARKKARVQTAGSSDGKTGGRFPDIWKRVRKKDDWANPGETPEFLPDWIDEWFHSESEGEDWEAIEHKRAEEFDLELSPEEEQSGQAR
jgi:hypothetical protein